MSQQRQPNVQPQPPVRLWTRLHALFRGDQPDFTSGPLGRAILLLAIPMVLEMLMQSVFSVVDIFFVGRLGPDAVAAVGLTDSLLVLVMAVGMGIGMAATAMVARRIGERDPQGAGAAAGQALLAGVAVSVPFGVLGVVFAPQLLQLMGATDAVVEVGAGYCAVLFGTNFTLLFLFLINAIFRGAGDAVLAMRALWLANAINIVLDPLLIFGIGPFPALGVTGAAVATAVGRGVGVTYQLRLLLGRRGRVPLTRRHLRLHTGTMRRLLRVSGPGMVQYLIGTASWLVVMRFVAVFGSAALAGYTIAIRILIVALLPSWGMGNAAATLVGQNLGANKPDRAMRSVWMTSFANGAFLGTVALGLYFFAEQLVLLFTDAPGAVAYGAACLRIVSYTYVFFAFGQVTVQAFNGAGDTRTPTLINFAAYWLVQLPLAYTLAHPLGLGADGIFWAIAIAQAVLALLGITLFRQGAWRRTVI